MAPPIKRPRNIAPDAAARSARIEALRKEKKWNNKTFAKELRIAETTAYKIRLGLQTPSDANLARMTKAFGVTAGWIMYGQGPRTASPTAADQHVTVTRKSTAGHPGVNDWLRNSAAGQATTKAERDWLRALPWPEDPPQASDDTYLFALQTFRSLQADVLEQRGEA